MKEKLRNLIFGNILKDLAFKKFLKTFAIITLILFVISFVPYLFGIPFMESTTFPDLSVFRPIFPKHGVQITLTLSVFFVEIISIILSTVIFLLTSKNQNIFKQGVRFVGYFFLYLFFSHWVIWFIVQPQCVGCTGSGSDDAWFAILFTAYSTIPTILILLNLLLLLLKKNVPRLKTLQSEVQKFMIIQLTFIFLYPVFIFIFLIFPLLRFFLYVKDVMEMNY